MRYPKNKMFSVCQRINCTNLSFLDSPVILVQPSNGQCRPARVHANIIVMVMMVVAVVVMVTMVMVTMVTMVTVCDQWPVARDGDQDDVVLDVQEAHAALARAEGDLARLQVDGHQADLAQLDDGHVQGRPVGGERARRWVVGLIGEKWSFPQIGCEKRKTICKRLRELTPGTGFMQPLTEKYMHFRVFGVYLH